MGGPGTTVQLRPMLAVEGPVPEGPGWAFEFAWDGARTLVEVQPGGVRLIGDGRGLASSYPELDVLGEVGRRHRLVLDGAIVALDAYGRPSPHRLARRMAVQTPSATMRRRLPVAYYVFDLLQLDDQPTTGLTYRQRRELLAELGLELDGGTVAVPPWFPDADGSAMLEVAAQYGLHGVVAKRVRSRYQPGRRSRSWVHTALQRTQEVVVGGWVPGAGRRSGAVGSLLVGVPTERGLQYVGRVATGFSQAEGRELAGRLTALGRRTSPFSGFGADAAPENVRWVAPELLGEVGYRRWTPRGHLDRPSWRALRPGKHPAAVQAPVLFGPPGGRGDHDDAAELAELDEAVRRARAEVDTLRAQISPHFLYNALNTIATYVRTDPQHARELLVDFAEFTRYTFRSGAVMSPLRAELDNAERYLTLERSRFGQRLAVQLQVQASVLAVEVPFLSVQLMVEHAVQRGIEPKPGGGTVTVCALSERGECLVSVSHDGAHAEPGPALLGLDARLRELYGPAEGLVVEDLAVGGSRISFRVPLP